MHVYKILRTLVHGLFETESFSSTPVGGGGVPTALICGMYLECIEIALRCMWQYIPVCIVCIPKPRKPAILRTYSTES